MHDKLTTTVHRVVILVYSFKYEIKIIDNSITGLKSKSNSCFREKNNILIKKKKKKPWIQRMTRERWM